MPESIMKTRKASISLRRGGVSSRYAVQRELSAFAAMDWLAAVDCLPVVDVAFAMLKAQ